MLNSFDNVMGSQLRTLPLDAKRDQVLSYLRNYDTASLLVVDNAESIRDPGLWRFLEGIPQPSAALVTTRKSLPCGGREIRVPEMEKEEAITLFFREARRSFPKWGEHLSSEERGSLAEIAGFMQGHPLAIKLVAGQSTKRSLAGIRDELRRNPPKKVSERFDVSYKGLEEGQRDLFSRLAIFSGSMDDQAIRSICLEDDPQGQLNWESNLEELVRSSFLDRAEIAALDEEGREVTLYRYRLHPLMRQYAAGKAGDALLVRLRPRAAKYFLEYARRFSNNFDMLEWERENVFVGMDWAVARLKSFTGEDIKHASSLVMEFMSALTNYLDTRGYWNEYRLRLQQSIGAAEVLEDRRPKAGWIHNLGFLAQNIGDIKEAQKLHHQSLKISQELGDKSGVARSLHHMGMLAQATGDHNEARKLYQQSLEIKQELGDKRGVASSMHQLGTLAQATGDHNEARKLYQQSLEIRQELGDKSGLSRLLHQMGMLAQATGDHNEARKLYQQSLKIKLDLGDKSGIALSRAQLALLEEKMGNPKEALQLILQAEATFQELGSPYAKLAGEVRQRLEQNQ
jgi:tetratricopeptide (TPR) repeat protein